MSRRLMYVIVAGLFVACEEPTGLNEVKPVALNLVESSCASCVLGPITIVRQDSKPQEATFGIAGDPSADYVIEIQEGGNQGADGSVILDGITLLAPRTKTEQTPRYKTLNIKLRTQSTLIVRPTGKPLSNVSVRILAGAKRLGEGGGEIAALGGAAVVRVPPGALALPTTIEIVVVDNPSPRANEGGRILRLLPAGLQFSVPVSVAWKVTGVHKKSGRVMLEVGDWLLPWPTSVDSAANILTFETTHFSDWRDMRFWDQPLSSGNKTIGFVPGTSLAKGPGNAEPLSAVELTEALATAAAIWRPLLVEVGVNLTVTTSPDPTIEVGFTDKPGTPTGYTFYSKSSNRRRIELDSRMFWRSFEHFRTGAVTDDDPLLATILAHELGHAIGLLHWRETECDLVSAWKDLKEWARGTSTNDIPATCLEPPLMAPLGKGNIPWALSRSERVLADGAYTSFLLGFKSAVEIQAGSSSTVSGSAGRPLAQALRVRAVDADGVPVAGVPVLFALAGDVRGSLTGAVMVTGTDGMATLGSWTLAADSQAPQQLQARAYLPSAAGPAQQQVTFTANVVSSSFVLKQLAVYGNASCALTDSEAAWCWGDNSWGQLGNNTTTNRGAPTPVAGGLSFQRLALGATVACGLSDGTAYCWGNNDNGQLGTPNGHLTPERVQVTGGETFKGLAAGGRFACGLTLDGAALCWGENFWGQLGNGTGFGGSTPTAVAGGHTFRTIATSSIFACGLTTSGAAWCWGNNSYGQLGNAGDRAYSPVEVASGLNFEQLVVGGGHVCGVVSRKAYCWGNNGSGQLGDGTTTSSTDPVAVNGGLSFKVLSAGNDHTCGIADDEKLYCWGSNASGQFGDGTLIDRNAPRSSGGGISFTDFGTGQGHMCGLTSSNVGYCWGANSSGQLGDGTGLNSLIPKAIQAP